jgi:hypothetical protein
MVDTAPPVAQRKWTDPPRLLPVLIVASAVSAFLFWALGHYRPDLDWSLFYNASFASLTGSTAASIGLWVYGFLAEEGQRREWRHDQEMRHFEAIYGPMYVDTRSLVETLQRYDLGYLGKFRDVKEGPFWPFVDPGIAEEVDALQTRLSEHSGLNYASAQSARRAIETALNLRFGADPAIEPMRRSLLEILVQDQRFLFDPDASEPHEAYLDNLRNAWRQYGPLKSDEPLKDIIRRAKEALLKDEVVQKRVATCREMLPLAEAANARILHRMKDPFE